MTLPTVIRMTSRPGPTSVRNIERPSRGRPSILVIGTLDTKSLEIGAIAKHIELLDGDVTFLDTSGRAHVTPLPEDFTTGRYLIAREDVAAAAGTSAEDVDRLPRGEAVAALRRGVAHHVTELASQGRIHAALCVGGAGAYIARDAFALLPVGFPKLIVSPLASGSRAFEPYVGTRDVATLHSVADIVGINAITEPIFRTAAGYIVGAARAAVASAELPPRPTVVISMNGNTTDALMRVRDILEASGRSVLAFHANGVGGRALEEFVATGQATAVLDYTTTELAGHEIGGLMDAGAGRMETAGRLGIPQVLIPGCLDFVTCGPPSEAESEFPGRTTFLHNPELTLVRLSADEMSLMGHTFAAKANRAHGTTIVVVPLKGFSVQDAEGKAFWAPESTHAFVRALQDRLDPTIPLHLVPHHINDAEFVDFVLGQLNLVLPRMPASAAVEHVSPTTPSIV